jgi:hypothetical protein
MRLFHAGVEAFCAPKTTVAVVFRAQFASRALRERLAASRQGELVASARRRVM